MLVKEEHYQFQVIWNAKRWLDCQIKCKYNLNVNKETKDDAATSEFKKMPDKVYLSGNGPDYKEMISHHMLDILWHGICMLK